MRAQRYIGWASWLVEATVVGLGLFVAPIVAVVEFATGDDGSGWKAATYFGLMVVYASALAFDMIRRPWARD